MRIAKEIYFLLVLTVIVFTLLIDSAPLQEIFWSVFAGIKLEPECSRLVRCMNEGGVSVKYQIDAGDAKCVLYVGEAAGYLRRFWAPELRGSLRTCEIMRGIAGKGAYE